MRFPGFAVILLAAVLGLASPASARPGALDPTFGDDGIVKTTPMPGGREAPADLTEAADGSLFVAGSATEGPGSIVFRYLPDGSLDPGFGESGRVRSAGDGWDRVELLDDGRVLLAGGTGTELRFTRLLADGNPDLTFGGTGSVTLSTAGLFTLPGGSVADASVSSLVVLGDGSLRAIGTFAGCGTTGFHCATALIAGVDQSGAPMAIFGPGGVKDTGVGGKGILSATLPGGSSLVIRSETGDPPYGDELYSTPVSASGEPGETKIISRGNSFYWSNLDWASGGITVDSEGRVLLVDSDHLWRLGPDGDGDPGFGKEGLVELGDLTRFLPGNPDLFATGVTVDEKGRIVISGGVSSGIGKQEWGGDSWASAGVAARLNPDGSIDKSFGGGGLQVLWRGKRSTQGLNGNTRTSALDQGIVVAGLGPAGDGFGFTLARAANDEMEMPLCSGQVVDFVGTSGADRVKALDSVVTTLGGDDVISGGYRTKICSGEGDDKVRLAMGPAWVFAGKGNDRVSLGDNGDNLARGGEGADTITGGSRPDLLLGDDGNDLLLGGSRDDRLFGGEGRDRLFGQDGRDRVFGGPGRDRVNAGPIGPDPTDYLLRTQGGTARVTTVGKQASFTFGIELVCRNDPQTKRTAGSSRRIPFDPRSGRLSRVTGTIDDVFADYGGSVNDIRATVKGDRITGRYRIVDNWDQLCRSGEGPLLIRSLLADAWVPFSGQAEPKPRQVARQN